MTTHFPRRLLTVILLLAPVPTLANPIETACIASGRGAATHELCGCIGEVAQLTLSGSDQRQAARFFRDPQRAQDTRMSDRRSDEVFWERYVAFTDAAEEFCS